MGALLNTIANYNPQAIPLENQLRRQQALEAQANTQQLQQAAITGQLRNQAAAIDLRDQSILSDAFTKVGGDPDKAVPMAVQNGLSPMGYFKYQNDVNAYHQGLSKYQADQLELLQKQNAQLGEGYATLKGLQGQARQDAIPDFIRQAQKVNPQFQADPQSLMNDQYLDTQIGLHGFTGTMLGRAKETAATNESLAKAGQAKAEEAAKTQETADKRRAAAADEYSALPVDAQGNVVAGPALDALNAKYKDVAPAGGFPTAPDARQNLILSTMSPKDRVEYLLKTLDLDSSKSLQPQNIATMVAGSIDPRKYPDQYARTVNDAMNAFAVGGADKRKLVLAAIKDGSDRIANRENAITQAAITAAPGREMAQAQHGQQSYQFATNEVEKYAKPVNDAIGQYREITDLLNQHDSIADGQAAALITKLVQGGTVRMSNVTLENVIGSRDKWQALQAFAQQYGIGGTSGSKITPEQSDQIRRLADAVGTRLKQKNALIQQTRNELAGSNNPLDHRQSLTKLNSGLTAVDMPAAAAPAGGAGRQYVRVMANAQGHQIGQTADGAWYDTQTGAKIQ